MAEAFTAGVKPGGLTDDTQIRILLCYLIKTAGPLTRDTLQGALLQEQLVNYFEFADALAEVQKQGLVTCTASLARVLRWPAHWPMICPALCGRAPSAP